MERYDSMAASAIVVFFLSAYLILSATAQTPADNICSSTSSPLLCRRIAPSNSSGNVYDLGRSCVRQSRSSSRTFFSVINNLLSLRSSLSTQVIRALEDCRSLAELNTDYVSDSLKVVDSTSATLSVTRAEDVLAWLSALLTNQETCLDSLRSVGSTWSSRADISVPLDEGRNLYSLSLSLFTKGWVPTTRRRPPRQSTSRSRQFPLGLSGRGRRIDEAAGGRKLLQIGAGGDSVLVSKSVTVSLDGTGNFSTIEDAIAAAPNNTNGDNGYFVIFVSAGVYNEYVNIAKRKRYLMMIGDGINRTIITGNHNVVDGWTTFDSASFIVTAPNFVGINMTIRNTAGASKRQAVALRNSADLSAFYGCSFEAYQDTLYTHSLRQFYRSCDIYGTVDFIFGNAAAVLQDCRIFPRQPMRGQFNAITAQGRTDVNQNTGLSFQNCVIGATDELASSNYSVQTYLGRPWKEFSRTVYMQSFMDTLINPAGWIAWSGDFALNTSYYAEYANTGPGSNTSGRVIWDGYRILNSTEQAVNFTASSFIVADQWLPFTGIPFNTGL